jgi:UPF0716 protein FxsA
MIVALLVVLFIVVPLVELYVIIQVGREIGALPTIGILIADSILGSLLLRSQGRAAWRRFNQALQERRPPAREVLDGALVIFGGALLLTPGFITDVLGLLLLIPPTRAVVRRILTAVLFKRFKVVGFGVAGAGAAARAARNRRQTGRPAPGREPYDIEGEAVDVDPPPPLPR